MLPAQPTKPRELLKSKADCIADNTTHRTVVITSANQATSAANQTNGSANGSLDPHIDGIN